MIRFNIFVVLFIILINFYLINNQRTNNRDSFSEIWMPAWRAMKKNLIQMSNNDRSILIGMRKLGKLQRRSAQAEKPFCNISTSYLPNFKSSTPPKSVNELRPGDIDIIAAIGDSITSGNGALSMRYYESFLENRGVSWSIGGQGTWRKYWTIPNFLKVFNPELYGFSTKDSLSTDRESRLNVAEPFTISSDLVYQANILLRRLKADPNVDMINHWKLITIFIGANDMCQTVCNMQNPSNILKSHRKDVVKVLRFLRDNIPKLIINWVPVPKVSATFRKLKGLQLDCILMQEFECNCVFKIGMSTDDINFYEKLNEKWQDIDKEVVAFNEFDREDFTVIYQPFLVNMTTPTLKNGATDIRFFASDCFHFSQLGHAAMANGLWNNMFQLEGAKQMDLFKKFRQFECPTEKRPFIITRKNSKKS